MGWQFKREEKHMSKWKRIVAGAIGTGLLFGSAAFAADVEARGKVQSVILYRGQALVTRAVPVEAAGQVQLVVTDLPERLQPESLYATAEKGAQVRAVRYRTRPMGQAPREEVQKLDDQIAAVEKDLRKNEADQQRLAEEKDYLTKLQNFVAPTAQVELTKGVLNDKTLTGLTQFIFAQTASLSDERLALIEKKKELDKQLTLLTQQRDQLTAGNTKTAREAVVFLDKEAAGATDVLLSYIVNGATWSPAYNLRATTDMKGVRVEYNAIISQMSGEDWDNATLSLATASPNLVSDAPLLAPMLIGLTRQPAPGTSQPQAGGKDQVVLTAAREQSRHVIVNDNRERAQLDWERNVASNAFQTFELAAPQESVREIQQSLRAGVSGLSATYKLAAPVSLASRPDQQFVRIADLALSATFSHVAIPLLTDNVYRQAEVTNNSEISLLEGTTAAYMNGDFVGKGTIPVVASGQRFTAGFGADPQIRVQREFVSKTEVIQGGNKETTYMYRLVLENYKEKLVILRAFDRIPYTQPEIRMTLGEMKLGETKPKLSEDLEYQRTLQPKGILRWDVEVPAKVSGANALALEYSYKLEYDRNMSIAPVTAGEEQQKLRVVMEKQMGAK